MLFEDYCVIENQQTFMFRVVVLVACVTQQQSILSMFLATVKSVIAQAGQKHGGFNDIVQLSLQNTNRYEINVHFNF